MPLDADFNWKVDCRFLGGLLGEDCTAVVFSLGLSVSTGSLMLSFFCCDETSSYYMKKK